MLAQDIAVRDGDAITIESSDVSLDLGGHIVSSSAKSGAMIRIAEGSTRVSIRNGRLEGGGSGIAHAAGSVRIRLSVEAVDVVRAKETAIDIGAAEHVDVVDCHIRSAGAAGIRVSGESEAFGGRFVGNTVEGVFRDGVDLVGLASGEVRNNVVADFGKSGKSDRGILLSRSAHGSTGGNVVEGNVVHVSGMGGDDGIALESGSNTVASNAVSGMNYDGIVVRSSGNRISENTVTGNGRHGIHVIGEQNRIEKNRIEANGGSGIYFEGDGANSYASNRFSGNSQSSVGGKTGLSIGTNNDVR